MNHLFDKFAQRARDPAKLFLETPLGQRLTYGDMLAGSARMARTLAALGVRLGDRVAVQVEKSPAAVLLYLGCLRLGAIFVPLNTAYTTAELDYFLADAEPRLMVCDSKNRGALAALGKAVEFATLDGDGRGSLSENADRQPAEFANAACGADDLAAILYTSGTTGRSKGAMLSHDNLASNAEALAAVWHFEAKDVLLHALPIYHTHGLFVAINVALLSNASMIFLSRFDADEVMRQLPRASVIMGVPTFYTRLLQHPALNRSAAAHMRLFISGSAPLLADTHRAWAERTGFAILERYGMTETGMNTSNPYDGERIAGTVGFPLPGVALRIGDPAGTGEMPQGEIGVIEIKGPNVFKGYWRREKSAQDFREDGCFVTGDLGLIDDRGYVHIVGRAKDLIISGGFNVYPKEIETEIDALPGVVESAVIGVPHPDFGEGVAAVVIPKSEANLTEAAILKTLEGRLAKFKLPKRVILAESLPRNSMGKVQKNLLREQYRMLFG